MKEDKVYTSFEELDRDIKIAKLERVLAEEKFKRGVHLVKDQFYPNFRSNAFWKKLGRQLLPFVLEWGLKKLRRS
jgi:hypothetical protein